MTKSKQQAYIKGIETNAFKNDAQRIFNIIKENPRDLNDLSFILKKSFNQISGRITELLDAGLIKEKQNGKYSIFSITEPREREALQRQRLTAKIEKFVKCGEKLGLDFTYKLKLC